VNRDFLLTLYIGYMVPRCSRTKRFVSFKTRAKRERAVNGEIQQPKSAQYSTHLPLLPYSRFPAELASMLLLEFSLFALVAALSQCLCSEIPYLLIKLYRIYVCYTNITLYIGFGIIRGFT
jgi:hypothetical protein